MDATVSSLDHVRDAIQVLGACPGIGRIHFITPSWDGKYATFLQNSIDKDDAATDADMEAACKVVNASYRAVETSELMLKTVTGLPQVNSFGNTVMGTCPNCNGDEDEPTVDILGNTIDGVILHASGHARVCWDDGDPLDTQHRRTDCHSGMKTVLCVDAHDAQWGGITTWEGIKAYSHSALYGNSYYSQYSKTGKA